METGNKHIPKYTYQVIKGQSNATGNGQARLIIQEDVGMSVVDYQPRFNCTIIPSVRYYMYITYAGPTLVEAEKRA